MTKMRPTKIAAIGFLLMILLLQSGSVALQDKTEPAGLLRLHVRANSDSPADQALKYTVRNAVLEACSMLLPVAHNAPEAEEILAAAVPQLQKAAQSAVLAAGFTYPVTVNMGEYFFPTRLYGNRVYSAGSYRALQVYIGEGSGQNWWCVLFPPLCFVEAAGDGVAAASGTEYKAPKPRSRLLEWWQRLWQKADSPIKTTHNTQRQSYG